MTCLGNSGLEKLPYILFQLVIVELITELEPYPVILKIGLKSKPLDDDLVKLEWVSAMNLKSLLNVEKELLLKLLFINIQFCNDTKSLNSRILRL